MAFRTSFGFCCITNSFCVIYLSLLCNRFPKMSSVLLRYIKQKVHRVSPTLPPRFNRLRYSISRRYLSKYLTTSVLAYFKQHSSSLNTPQIFSYRWKTIVSKTSPK
ncbi:cysteine-rich receptor-like protein kinase 10 [Streptococcus ruminantium]|uniref:Cysteine-rich receptor-like protein kinase 10 n=1 Tax=Streptococcus ruminantium TaxID=1917441 RepID=A0A2Z5U3U1_9STRE|nr:cysteine-rich receptor-like protein kinase 10 [Streptococcus ruminantium]